MALKAAARSDIPARDGHLPMTGLLVPDRPIAIPVD